MRRPNNLIKYIDELTTSSPINLPKLSTNTLRWIEQARPMVGGFFRDFRLEPFWIDVYEDNHSDILISNGRQTFKSTFGTDIIACAVTSQENVEATYVGDRADRVNAWSKQRFRKDTFLRNPTLAQFLPHGHANVSEVNLVNNSVAYARSDENEYNNVQGMTNVTMVFDECQFQDQLPFRSNALNSMTLTKGRAYWLGIGGEAGSEWHKMWVQSDQRQWIYDDRYWRDKLTHDSKGDIDNDVDRLKSILAGRWVAQVPENHRYRGYNMPQTIFARIPLTIDDAILKYRTRPDNSIEYHEKYDPKSLFISQIMGGFYKAVRRPITPEMVQACYVPYLSLLSAHDVRELKIIHGNKIRIYMGVDFGSGPSASQTVISIVIHWRKSNRFQLAWIDPRPQENQLDQARYISELGHSYNVDYAVGDLGYGQLAVKLIQDGGRDSRDIKFNGLGRRRFSGCRTIGSEVKPTEQYHQDTDEHGTELGRIQIDKTTSIQGFIDMIERHIAHPLRPNDETLKVTQFMIPYANDYDVDFLLDDFCSITRKDLELQQDIAVEDPRQKPRKEFNHPPDSVMSIIYSLVALNNYDESRYSIRKSRRDS